MKLKDLVSDYLVDLRKLTEYALNPDNPKGSDKAIMFQRYLGFTKENYIFLLEQILTQVPESEAIATVADEHGQRYQVDLEIRGIEKGTQEIVRTGWIVESNSDVARLVTLYVRKRA
jgi:hypothetical protein